MAMNLGLAIEDVAMAHHVYKEAKKAHVGRMLPL
jgi:ornithine cyclodeaminase/alanine dehydrogenase-like protein (mu-crystallin family)